MKLWAGRFKSEIDKKREIDTICNIINYASKYNIENAPLLLSCFNIQKHTLDECELNSAFFFTFSNRKLKYSIFIFENSKQIFFTTPIYFPIKTFHLKFL